MGDENARDEEWEQLRGEVADAAALEALRDELTGRKMPEPEPVVDAASTEKEHTRPLAKRYKMVYDEEGRVAEVIEEIVDLEEKAAEEDCQLCSGSGKILDGNRKCPDCGGSGKVPAKE